MAQTFQLPIQTVLDSDGDPVSGAKVSFYDAGTTNAKTVYTEETLTTAHSQPVVADSAGRLPLIYVPTGDYKVVITDADDNAIGTYDDLDTGIPSSGGALAVADGGTGATTAAGARTNLGAASQTEVTTLSSSVSSIETDIAALPGAALNDMAGEPDVGVDNLATGYGVVTLKETEIDSDATATAGTGNTFPMDNTIPQRTEGLEILSGSFTPDETGTTLEFEVEVHIGGRSGDTNPNGGAVALFASDSLNAIAVGLWQVAGQGDRAYCTCHFKTRVTSGGSALTYSVRVGAEEGSGSNVWYVNGSESQTGGLFGGKLESYLRVRELKTV